MTANINRWAGKRGQRTVDLDAPRPESVYDHVNDNLLAELFSRVGVGGADKLLAAIPPEQWDQAEQRVIDYLAPPKEKETEVDAPVSKPETHPQVNSTSSVPQNTITRIDLKDFPNQPGIEVKKWADGWTPNSRPVEISTQRQMTLDQMVAWLEERGWKVYRWEACPVLGIPQGARAFKGTPRSVRTKYQLKLMRDKYVQKADAYFRTPESYDMSNISVVHRIHAIDLAFEL